MLFRVGLGLGALGVGWLAHEAAGFRLPLSLDGNQVGLLTGSVLIILGAIAAAGVLRVRSV
jgi:hypothetical protein